MGSRLLAMVCVVWLFWTMPAGAQGSGEVDRDAQARHLYRNGEQLYSEGLYKDAIAAWSSAYNLSARPLILYNMANAQERMGLWQDALDSLNRYRAYAPADERDTLTKRISNLERHLWEQKQQEQKRAAMAQQPQPQPLLAPQPRPQPLRQQQVRVKPVPHRVQPVTMEKSRWVMGPAAISMFAVSGVGAATGTVFALRARAARQAATEMCTSDGTIFCPSSAGYAIRQDRISSVVADAGFGIALTGSVIATVLAVSSKKRLNGTTMSLAPTPRGAGLRLSNRF